MQLLSPLQLYMQQLVYSLIYSNLTSHPKPYLHRYTFLFVFDFLYNQHHRLVYLFGLYSVYKHLEPLHSLTYPNLTNHRKLFQSNCIVFFVFDYLYIQHHKAAHRCSKYLDDKHGEPPNSLIYSNLTNYPKLYHHHYRFLFLFDYLYSPHHRLVYRYLLSSQYKLLMHN